MWAALSLMLIPGTPMYDDYQAGRFELIEPDEMLAELRTMIAETHQTQGLFHANHASNYLPIRARMPKDKKETLALIDAALDGKVAPRPEWMAGTLIVHGLFGWRNCVILSGEIRGGSEGVRTGIHHPPGCPR